MPTRTRPQGGRVHYTHAAAEASYDSSLVSALDVQGHEKPTQQLVWSVMLWRQITLHRCWKTYTGYPGKDPVQAIRVLASKCQHSLAPPYLSAANFNKSLEWSPDSVRNRQVRKRSSYQLLEGRHWVTERFLSLPPRRGTVCRQLGRTGPPVLCRWQHRLCMITITIYEQSLLRQPCIHSVEPWKLIYSPHLSRHLSYIVCILS